ncbi:3-methyladenine DNA glycosylase [Pseudomonas reactans]|uniref:3-methyladenine DNA glycosylase n=1 Tax=Pseudomonas reactans TaxID=117680 RepID=A0ABX2QQR2_9PSED|nr:3-methyladenine DNA glycosylase [Pseudomonas reactans]NWA43818.1 3-methyladenine DNA glycosylase [Pseudomonas reactans]NWD94154.1 3-methyladenine DNA glycosylase [Pseudomonas reactans]NWF12161.1 3-methyladenine DNA glycosylase [Pseudomonas reactans]
MTVRTLGKHFKNPLINGNAVFVATLITPQENVNGIIIRSLTASGGTVTIGTGVPANGNDRFDRSHMRIPVGLPLYYDVLVPAGMGVFMNTSASFNIPVEMSWDVLNADGSIA